MSNIIDAVKFAADKKNLKVVKAILASQNRLANMIVDRVHTLATLVEGVVDAKGDPDAFLDIALPGARQEIENLHARVNKIHEESNIDEVAHKIAATGRWSFLQAKTFLSELDSPGKERVLVSAAVLTNARVIHQDDFCTVLQAEDGRFFASKDPFRQEFVY